MDQGNQNPATSSRWSRDAASPDSPPTAPRQKGRFKSVVFMIAVTVVFFGALVGLLSYRPAFYSERIQARDSKQEEVLSDKFIGKSIQFYNDWQGAPHWVGSFDEAHINAWLARDVPRNHAASLPEGVSEPRIALDGDVLWLGFLQTKGPMTMVVQIGFRIWVPKRNMLVMELVGAWIGALPLPTSQTRRVIEQIAYAQSMEVEWKRNNGRLVAIFQFPRGYREKILEKVEIRTGSIEIKGVNVRPHQANIDYAPSAN